VLQNQISVIQVGDVHYPDLLTAPTLADVKDDGLCPSKVDAISSTRIAEIARSLQETLVSHPNISAVVLCGDITTRGKLDGYRNGLTFLQSALKLGDADIWENKRLIAIPGNHDVDRKSIDPNAPISRKFEPLAALWKDVGHGGAFHYETPEELPITLAGTNVQAGLTFFPLNTCSLCGEHRALPLAMREKLAQALKVYSASISETDYLNLLAEQVDCPAIERSHVDSVVKSIRKSREARVPIIVGHHPLLPQAVVRVDGYTELLNGGFIRESLLATEKNVVYLHGHIHQDPVHAVSNKTSGSNRIISISAPALEDGFNLLTFTFSASTQQPLGLEIQPYRFADHTGIVPVASHTLRLADEGVLWNEVEETWISFVLDCLATPALVLRLQDLLKKIPPRLKKIDDTDAKKLIIRALKILELLEVVEIRNRRNAAEHWQCQRRVL
jgi:predicted phosphodiesterase